MLQVITEERVAKEATALLEAENVEKQRKYEVEKLQLHLECQRLSAFDAKSSTENSQGINKLPNFELKTRNNLFNWFSSKSDGRKIEREVNTTCVKIRLGGRTLPLNLFAIPGVKNNNTLLGMEIVESSGIVLNVKRKTWFFDDQPKRQFLLCRTDSRVL
ncbi:hypothetical protein NPIL_329421 [Nephila pilipes]|uniref:Uncharacterized protein n=1 Tax=Nephila pilipes TaxID=299642 RepID=A0A8X6THN3_NEPPI|nr:hypothetical protein NPIL_329421 [Nephila pilipes]